MKKKPYCRMVSPDVQDDRQLACYYLAQLIAINDNLDFFVEGRIIDDVGTLLHKVCNGLKAEGWTWAYNHDKLIVHPPADAQSTSEIRRGLIDRFWKSVEPSINGYSNKIQSLLESLTDKQLKQLVDGRQ